MAVRPFYIEAEIEGRKTNLAGGTRKKDGDHTIHIYQRNKGDITEPFRIRQYYTEMDGEPKLVTAVYYQGELIKNHITDY